MTNAEKIEKLTRLHVQAGVALNLVKADDQAKAGYWHYPAVASTNVFTVGDFTVIDTKTASCLRCGEIRKNKI